MRVLILGGDGMLGHQLYLQLRQSHEVSATVRQTVEAYDQYGIFERPALIGGIDVRSQDRLAEVIAAVRPDAVVNCVGIVKQRPTAKDSMISIEVNALLPHRLAILCKMTGARLVHISTDCVFSGSKGMYTESDVSDAEDLYGRSKYLGEVAEGHCITLRTSIIGPELSRKTSLLEWFLAQSGNVRGFSKAIFSGFTTIELSRIIDQILVRHPDATGLYQVSSEPIDKHNLLLLMAKYLSPAMTVVEDDTLKIDRSLDSSRFRRAFDYRPPSWEAMIEELANRHNVDHS